MNALQLNTNEEGDDEELPQAVVNRLVALKQLQVSILLVPCNTFFLCAPSFSCLLTR